MGFNSAVTFTDGHQENNTFTAINRAGGPTQLFPYHSGALRGKGLALVTGSSCPPTTGV